MAEGFGSRLRERLLEQGPLCVGVDPTRELLAAWGREDTVEGVEFCALATLEAVVGVSAVIKPQVAFFERFGAAGFRVLERLLTEARDADVLVIADAKRGDFAPTNEGYADTWLSDRSPLAADAVTVHPYLGVGALAPFFAAARGSGRGVFVLAATSNPEGRALQGARVEDGARVEEMVLGEVRELNRGDEAPGSIGVVFGATRTRPDFDLTTLGGPYLVPGVGAQGAGPADVARLFAGCAPGTVVASVSRAILRAGPERRGLRDAAARWRDDLRESV
jgi:orotidine-5'-phosphate decarboxylase